MTNAITLKVVGPIAAIGADDWDRCAGDDNPLVSHAFLAALEAGGAVAEARGVTPCHATALDDDGGVVGVLPLYLKTHSLAEYGTDDGWDEWFRAQGRSYYPKLQVEIPYSPVAGQRLLVPPGPDRRRIATALATGATRIAEARGVSSLHVAYADAEDAALLAGAGWIPDLGYQYHWFDRGYGSFEGFVAALRKTKRAMIRHERRAVRATGLRIERLTGDAITPAHWDAFHAFHRDTLARKRAQLLLNREVFDHLGGEFSRRVMLVMAWDGPVAVAGTLFLIGGTTLHTRYWGCLRDVPLLHFECCYYQAIEYALEHGLTCIDGGAGGRHKVARGYLPVPVHHCHWVVRPEYRGKLAEATARKRSQVVALMERDHARSPYSAKVPFPETGQPVDLRPTLRLSRAEALQRGRQLLRVGSFDAAEKFYRAIVRTAPDDARALGRLGVIGLRGCRDAQALADLDRAVAANSSIHWLHNARGAALERLGRSDEAAAAFRAALRVRPGNTVSADGLRRVVTAQGRLDQGPARPAGRGPRVLAFTIGRNWTAVARLPASLCSAGFDVAALCPTDSLLALSNFICERHTAYPPENFAENLAALIDAVDLWRPELIIPGDEWCAHFLHRVHALGGDVLPAHVAGLVRRSCGDPGYFEVVADKARTVAEAAGLGLRVPPSVHDVGAAAVDGFAAAHGVPMVVKGAIGVASQSVRVCRDVAAAAKAVSELGGARIAGAARRQAVTLQKFIDGTAAAITFVALNGRLLDCFIYQSEQTAEPGGPSSVVRLIGNSEIEEAARRLVARFGFTGFGGFDFMIDSGTGAAYLLEFNPRLTVTSHLGAMVGHDLTMALHAAMTGAPAPPPSDAPCPEMVALFPQEWWRDRESPHLRALPVDIPWSDTRLLRHLLSTSVKRASP